MFVHPFMCPRCFLFSPDRTDFFARLQKICRRLRSERVEEKKIIEVRVQSDCQKRSKSDRILENVTFLRAAITHLRL